MPDLPILSLATLFVIFISLLFALFLFTVKTKNKLSNILIGLYTVLMAATISVFFYRYYFNKIPLTFDMLRDQINYLSHPILYLYVLSAIYYDFKLKRKHLLHVIPFIIIILVFYPNFYGVNEAERYIFMGNFLLHSEAKINTVFGHSVLIFYLALIFIELHKYKKLLLQNYSNASNFNYRWLFQLSVLVSVLYGFVIYKNIYRYITTDFQYLSYFRIFIALFLLGFIIWMVLKSMYNPKLFRGISSNLKLIETNKIDDNSRSQKKMESEYLNKITRLKNHMIIEKPFLEPTLTIQQLAKQLEMPIKDVSILINHYLGQHFFDFVNGYRIDKAIEILEDPSQMELTILEILYQVGFNSKSSFHTSFKKRTKMTPLKYRAMHFSQKEKLT